MRKLIIFICLITFSSSFARAQEWGDYVQLSVGSGTTLLGGSEGFFLQGEYGKTYKWLDLSLSMTYQTEEYWKDCRVSSWIVVRPDRDVLDGGPIQYKASNDKVSWTNNTSVSINTRVDIVKFFTKESRHSVKVGVGLGVAFEQWGGSEREVLDDGRESYFLSTGSEIYLLPNARISYDFSITPKIALGIFGHAAIWAPVVGVNVRYNFIKQ